MKFLLTTVILCIFFAAKAADTTKVLFVGNSITYFNDMPQTFEAIANERGDLTKVTMYAPGGTGFVHHVENPIVYNYFREGDWDYVVLQPGSNESPGYSFPIAETLERGRQLIDSIDTYNPCAKVLFYEISYGVWGATEENLATYNETMGLIKTNLTLLADSTESFFAPAGECFRTAWNDDQTTMLWGGTGDIHPNSKGSYIAACSFYSSIFQKPSLGSSYHATLTEDEALTYQELADTTVLEYLPDWRINTYNSHSAYDYTFSNDTLYYADESVNIDSLLWDFGDGNYSTDEDGFHFYTDGGDFLVRLITYSNGCTDTLTFELGVLSIEENSEINQFTVYPNPASDWLNINGMTKNFSYAINIYNSQGKQLMFSNSSEINISNLPDGVYYLRILNEEKHVSETIRWIKL